MLRQNHIASRRMVPPDVRLGEIRTNIARSMIGRIVDLSPGAGRTVHGIVTAVLAEAGIPKLVVGGAPYDLNQVLTATPAWLG